MNMSLQRSVLRWGAALVAVAFGLLTLKEGGTVLFGSEAARGAAGNFVPFVLWFNFLAGFVYVIAGVGLWMRRCWSVWLAMAIAAATMLVFVAFGTFVYAGGAYEIRTVIAMIVRSVVWMVIAVVAWRVLSVRPAMATRRYRS